MSVRRAKLEIPVTALMCLFLACSPGAADDSSPADHIEPGALDVVDRPPPSVGVPSEDGGAQHLVLGLPEGLPDYVPIMPDLTVIDSAVGTHGNLVVVLSGPISLAEVDSFYAAELERSGWSEETMRGAGREEGGFRTAYERGGERLRLSATTQNGSTELAMMFIPARPDPRNDR